MSSPTDQQLFQVHSAYAAMLQQLVLDLVTCGALPKNMAVDTVDRYRTLLLAGPATGETIDDAAAGLAKLSKTMRNLK